MVLSPVGLARTRGGPDAGDIRRVLGVGVGRTTGPRRLADDVALRDRAEPLAQAAAGPQVARTREPRADGGGGPVGGAGGAGPGIPRGGWARGGPAPARAPRGV